MQEAEKNLRRKDQKPSIHAGSRMSMAMFCIFRMFSILILYSDANFRVICTKFHDDYFSLNHVIRFHITLIRQSDPTEWQDQTIIDVDDGRSKLVENVPAVI
jgi:hypothetical protein